MNDTELDDTLNAIETCRRDREKPGPYFLKTPQEVLRDAVLKAVAAQRERDAKIADDCAKERELALAGFPVVLTPERSLSYWNVAAKQSEAERIRDAILKGGPTS